MSGKANGNLSYPRDAISLIIVVEITKSKLNRRKTKGGEKLTDERRAFSTKK